MDIVLRLFNTKKSKINNIKHYICKKHVSEIIQLFQEMIFMQRLKFFVFFQVIFLPFQLQAQVGGKNTFEFLNLPSSARVASLGGNNLSIWDNDLSMAYYNPSLLNSSMNNNIAMNYCLFMAGINYGYLSYAREIPSYGTFAVGMHYINYGHFTETDETGLVTGKFSAGEYNLNLIWAKPVLDTMFTVGANLKTVYSDFNQYYSVAMLIDAGITYHNKKIILDAALVLKNIGVQFKPYTPGNNEPVPFDVQVGVTKKLQHAPFRISMVFHDALTPNMTYVINPTDTSSTVKKMGFLVVSDKILRHFILGVEFIPTKNFFVNVGYNHQRRQELQIETRPYLTGFSWGFGFKINKFRFSYGRARYHLASASNNFSVSVNLGDFYRKVTIEEMNLKN